MTKQESIWRKIILNMRKETLKKTNEEELRKWIGKSNYPIKRFFNTSGILYKELKLKDKLENMSKDEQIKLLSTDGMLVKRPIVVGEDKILVAFKEDEWEVLKSGR